MDRAANNLVNEPPIADAPPAPVPTDLVSENLDLPLRKQRLVEAARAIDPLSPLRRRPFVTVATAAAIGVVAASPAAARTVSQLIPGGTLARLLKSPALTRIALRTARAVSAKFMNPKSDPVRPESPPP